MRFSKDKKINEVVKSLLKSGWELKSSNRHVRLVMAGNPNTITVPGSPSDGRSFQNWLHHVKHSGAIL